MALAAVISLALSGLGPDLIAPARADNLRGAGRHVLDDMWGKLVHNIGSGDTKTFNKPVFPKGEVMGVGFHEAPRGALSHWVVIDDGKIKNYQCVVPSTCVPFTRSTRASLARFT